MKHAIEFLSTFISSRTSQLRYYFKTEEKIDYHPEDTWNEIDEKIF